MLELVEIKHSECWELHNNFFNPELVNSDELSHLDSEDQAYLINSELNILIDIGKYSEEYAIEAFWGTYDDEKFFDFRSTNYNEILKVVEKLLIDIDSGQYKGNMLD